MGEAAEANELIESARRILTPEAVAELSAAYDDSFVFPESHIQELFPGRQAKSLLIAHENQGVCTWGLELDGVDAGKILVTGEEAKGGARVYCESLDEFAETRRWDAVCFSSPLLQAQANRIDDRVLAWLRESFDELTPTYDWPAAVVLRFEGRGLRVMLWIDDSRTDWWICGEERGILAELVTFANLAQTIWSNDEHGMRILSDLKLEGLDVHDSK